MMVNSIEQSLNVDLALFTCSIYHYLDITSGSHFAVKGSLLLLIAVVEIQFLRDLFQRSIDKDILPVKDYDRIDDILKIADLMS